MRGYATEARTISVQIISSCICAKTGHQIKLFFSTCPICRVCLLHTSIVSMAGVRTSFGVQDKLHQDKKRIFLLLLFHILVIGCSSFTVDGVTLEYSRYSKERQLAVVLEKQYNMFATDWAIYSPIRRNVYGVKYRVHFMGWVHVTDTRWWGYREVSCRLSIHEGRWLPHQQQDGMQAVSQETASTHCKPHMPACQIPHSICPPNCQQTDLCVAEVQVWSAINGSRLNQGESCWTTVSGDASCPARKDQLCWWHSVCPAPECHLPTPVTPNVADSHQPEYFICLSNIRIAEMWCRLYSETKNNLPYMQSYFPSPFSGHNTNAPVRFYLYLCKCMCQSPRLFTVWRGLCRYLNCVLHAVDLDIMIRITAFPFEVTNTPIIPIMAPWENALDPMVPFNQILLCLFLLFQVFKPFSFLHWISSG